MNKNPKRAAELAAYFTHAKLQVRIGYPDQSILLRMSAGQQQPAI